MKIPLEINYVSVSLTMRCNLGCSYCINEQTGSIKRVLNEIDGESWVSIINSFKLSEDLPITFEGGEPSMHKDFYKIISGVNHPINILTNLTFDVDEFIRNVDPRKLMRNTNRAFKAIRVSYHAKNMEQDKIVEKALKLQDSGFTIGIFGINSPDVLYENITMAEKCRKSQIYFYVKDFLGWNQDVLYGVYRYPGALYGVRSDCECRTNELLIAPDGNVYKCHRDMYQRESPVGNIIDSNFKVEYLFRSCTNYGFCNPCDVKLKANRFLQGGKSSVEIENIKIKE